MYAYTHNIIVNRAVARKHERSSRPGRKFMGEQKLIHFKHMFHENYVEKQCFVKQIKRRADILCILKLFKTSCNRVSINKKNFDSKNYHHRVQQN